MAYEIEDRHLLKLARQDLCFAIQFATDIIPYQLRMFGTVVAITRQLGDKEQFIEYMKKQGMSCVDCLHKSHLRKCEIHNEL